MRGLPFAGRCCCCQSGSRHQSRKHYSRFAAVRWTARVLANAKVFRVVSRLSREKKWWTHHSGRVRMNGCVLDIVCSFAQNGQNKHCVCAASWWYG